MVFAEICKEPIPSVGTPVTVVLAPLLKIKMSLTNKVVRLGVQLVDVPYAAVPV